MNTAIPLCTAFIGMRRVSSGTHLEVALALKAVQAGPHEAMALVFDDDTGQQIDFDLRGTEGDIARRLDEAVAIGAAVETPRGPGRPRLGVVAREVTLLPRHWDWLAQQPGGASVTLRKLVEDARRSGSAPSRRRAMQERAYRFMSALAGDLSGFEEASRALFADHQDLFGKLTRDWPDDIRAHAAKLAFEPVDDRPR